MGFRLAHISDVHFGPLPPVARRQLLSKRITGYVNWHSNRSGNMGVAALGALTDGLEDLQPDHIAITGDLTNLALEAEYKNTAAWLGSLGNADNISVIPGNHDAYVPRAMTKGLPLWAAWMVDDATKTAPKDNSGFPYTRVRGPVQIIGCSSAVATPAFVAAGRFGAQQAERLAAYLRDGKEHGLFRVVLIHHPPVQGAAKARKRLFGIGRFQSVIEQHGAELVLHGHTHLPQRHMIADNVPVYGVPAASEAPGGHRPPAAVNIFDIERSRTGFRCTHEEWSVTSVGAMSPLSKTDENQLY
ncbi:MAG: metallophosphoesterase [Pseudomonadota bacterium]